MTHVFDSEKRQRFTPKKTMMEKGVIPLSVIKWGEKQDPDYWKGEKGKKHTRQFFKENPQWAFGGKMWEVAKIEEMTDSLPKDEVVYADEYDNGHKDKFKIYK